MPARTSPAAPAGHRPRRSPLANPGLPHLTRRADPAANASRRPAVAVPEPRVMTMAEFGDYLRQVNNRHGRPYEESTINATCTG